MKYLFWARHRLSLFGPYIIIFYQPRWHLKAAQSGMIFSEAKW